MAIKVGDKRREDLRESLWPNSADKIWKGAKEKGYSCIPRVLPLILRLLSEKRIVGVKNCSSVYVELLSRSFDQGIIEIRDEDEHAYCADYTGNRARRTWQERIWTLKEAGFIEIAPKGNRPIGYILLNHPVQVALALKRAGKIDAQWWNLFQEQLRNHGAPLAVDALAISELRMIKGGVVNETSADRKSSRKAAARSQ